MDFYLHGSCFCLFLCLLGLLQFLAMAAGTHLRSSLSLLILSAKPRLRSRLGSCVRGRGKIAVVAHARERHRAASVTAHVRCRHNDVTKGWQIQIAVRNSYSLGCFAGSGSYFPVLVSLLYKVEGYAAYLFSGLFFSFCFSNLLKPACLSLDCIVFSFLILLLWMCHRLPVANPYDAGRMEFFPSACLFGF